jgi:aminotransferase
LTVGAPHPLQIAGAAALRLGDAYYRDLSASYERRRGLLVTALAGAGLAATEPEGAYYVMTDVGSLGVGDDVAFADWLVREIGVAAVPGSSFYHDRVLGRHQVRFTFCKSEATLAEAGRRLASLPERLSARTSRARSESRRA